MGDAMDREKRIPDIAPIRWIASSFIRVMSCPYQTFFRSLTSMCRSLGTCCMGVSMAGPSLCNNAFRSAVISSTWRIQAFHPMVDHLTCRARSWFLIAPFLLDPLPSVPPGSLLMYVLLYRDCAIDIRHFNIDNDFIYLFVACLRHAPCSPAWRHW